MCFIGVIIIIIKKEAYVLCNVTEQHRYKMKLLHSDTVDVVAELAAG